MKFNLTDLSALRAETIEVEAVDARQAALAHAEQSWRKVKTPDRHMLRLEIATDDGLVWKYDAIPEVCGAVSVRRVYSPPLELYRVMRRGRGDQWSLSRIQGDHADKRALRLAIESGMRFDPGDVAELASRYGHAATEADYAIACGHHFGYGERGVFNRSFCQSYERWQGRKPFIVRDPENKTGTRMHVRREFRWLVDGKAETLECTSFADDGQSFIGTLTEKPRDEKGWSTGPTKVLRRIRITHDAIKAWHRHLDGKTDEPAPPKSRPRKARSKRGGAPEDRTQGDA